MNAAIETLNTLKDVDSKTRQEQIVNALSGLLPKHALLYTPEDTTL